jgi:hypothetical protein
VKIRKKSKGEFGRAKPRWLICADLLALVLATAQINRRSALIGLLSEEKER